MRRLNLVLCAGALAACASSKSSERPEPEWADWKETETTYADPASPNSGATSTGVADADGDRRPAADPARADTSVDARDGRTPAADERAEAASDRADALDESAETRSATATPAGRVAKEGVEKDNTDINERDTDDQTLTPMDQGGSESDRKITQRIRQAVVGDDSLSFTAKNVKIITIDGKVTLRGPVKSEQERATIGAAAKQVAGARVDNQLEVAK